MYATHLTPCQHSQRHPLKPEMPAPIRYANSMPSVYHSSSNEEKSIRRPEAHILAATGAELHCVLIERLQTMMKSLHSSIKDNNLPLAEFKHVHWLSTNTLDPRESTLALTLATIAMLLPKIRSLLFC